MRALLALPLVAALAGASPLPGLPRYTAGYTGWTKLNSKPIPPRPVDAHRSVKNVYASKVPRAGRYPVGTVIVKEGRQRSGAPVTLIAVMRKLRVTGPHNGWQMIEWTRPSGNARFTELARGSVCTSCHFRARKTDYVFTKRR
ncbi:MAG TPA: cytochrome P460 family protein [Gaiellaceae bacterium]|nr:cytochrome P460 family protein [Gaiellaceae bacterium]